MGSILVTGAAGFIGSHLCERLLNDGLSVVGMDNFDDFYDPAIKRANLSDCSEDRNFTLIEADIRDQQAVDAVFKTHDIDCVVHLAARAGVRPSLEQPILYQDVNVHGTVVLLEASRKTQVPRFVFASSSSVYGNNTKVPFAEDDNVDYPISPYAATKKAGELICHTWHHIYQMHITCLRFFTVYGPRQRPDLAIHKFARLITDGEPIPVFGDGSMKRDFTYIDDIIQGVTAATDHCEGYNVYNLGESQPIRLDTLIAELEYALGEKAIIKRQSVPSGDVRQTYADISRARQELGYNPTTDLKTGLGHFVEWFRTHPS